MRIDFVLLIQTLLKHIKPSQGKEFTCENEYDELTQTWRKRVDKFVSKCSRRPQPQTPERRQEQKWVKDRVDKSANIYQMNLYQADTELGPWQGIIQKKSASSSQMLPLIIFDKKTLFFQKQCYFTVFPGKTKPKVPFFKDSGHCPKILDYTLHGYQDMSDNQQDQNCLNQ